MKSIRSVSLRSVIFACLLACLISAVAGDVFRAGTVRLIAQSEVRVTPFVLERAIYFCSANPAGKLANKETIARRSDGTTVRIISVGPLARDVHLRELHYLDGSTVGLADFLKSKTSWPASEQQAAWLSSQMLHSAQNCVTVGETLVAERAAVLDHEVAVVKRILKLGPTLTVWRAPDLGCAELQYRIEDPQPDGSYKLVTEDRAVSLKLVEPDPALFDEGRDYAELRPSVQDSRIDAWFGVTSVGENILGPRAQADRDYDQRWARR